MGEFLDAALSFPAVLFTFLLAVVVLYWLLVVLGTLDLDLAGGDDGGTDGGDNGGTDGFLDGLGLGGVPVTVSVSVLIVFAWFVAIVGGLALAGLDGAGKVLLGIGVLLVAVIAGLLAARLVALPLRKLYVSGTEPSRSDFVGRACVIRTGRVSTDFGQAEVTAADGSSAVIQVRQTGEHELAAGRLALIFDYDTDGEFFWVAPAT
ncbi:hypothetical protein [Actinophytocola sp.]|jgi:hypothetical protein|uniref:hypothetical protein n=1 Tax=Actinophytocola sp. TaxID=1872138 RepID=UPI002EDA7262